MSRLDDLAAGWSRLKQGTLWSSTGRCKGFAVQNPGEAAKLDAYVAAIVAGQSPIVPPLLATATGQGLVQMLTALITAPAAPYTVAITGTPKQGQKLTAVTA